MKNILLVFFLSGLFACSRVVHQPLQVVASKQFSGAKIDSVVLVPLSSEEANTQRRNQQFLRALKGATSFDVAMHGQTGKSKDPLTIARSYAGNGEVAAVLFGEIKKTGSANQKISEYQPVSFSVALFDTELRQVVWRADYRNFNKPVTDNLFELGDRLDRGLSYRTSDQFFEEGFQRVAQELERSRHSAVSLN